MTLTDTGPLVAVLDQDDPSHRRYVEILSRLPRQPLLTTWPCFTEAMYLLAKNGGIRYQNRLWQLRNSGKMLIYDLTEGDMERMEILMAKYHDTPMDLADASLVAVAESLSMGRVFTVDSDFYIYRLADGSALEVIG